MRPFDLNYKILLVLLMSALITDCQKLDSNQVHANKSASQRTGSTSESGKLAQKSREDKIKSEDRLQLLNIEQIECRFIKSDGSKETKIISENAKIFPDSTLKVSTGTFIMSLTNKNFASRPYGKPTLKSVHAWILYTPADSKAENSYAEADLVSYHDFVKLEADQNTAACRVYRKDRKDRPDAEGFPN
jgi:hypothetical protein